MYVRSATDNYLKNKKWTAKRLELSCQLHPLCLKSDYDNYDTLNSYFTYVFYQTLRIKEPGGKKYAQIMRGKYLYTVFAVMSLNSLPLEPKKNAKEKNS